MADPTLMHLLEQRLRASAHAAGVQISNRRISRRAYFLQRVWQRGGEDEADRLAAEIERFWQTHKRDHTRQETAALVGRAVTRSFGKADA
jgi:hypothetical protein